MNGVHSEAAIVAYKGEENAIKEITKIYSLSSFPYHRFFVPPSKELFQRLKNFKPRYLSDKPYVDGYFSRYRLFMPPLHNERYYTIPHSIENVDNIDCLMYHHIEDIMIAQAEPGSPSLFQVWKDTSLLEKAVSRALRFPMVDTKSMRLSLNVEYGEVGYSSLTQMKSLLNVLIDYKNPNIPNILDLSARWGERLLAAMALDCNYTGYVDMENPYTAHTLTGRLRHAILEFSHQMSYKTKLDIKNLPFRENVNSYDIVIYEPQKKKNADWMVKELFFNIYQAWTCLNEGGKMVILLHDDHDSFVCEAMNLFIEQLISNSSYSGAICYQTDKDKTYPIWIWEKKTVNKIIWNPPMSKRPFWVMYPLLKDKLITGQIKGIDMELYSTTCEKKKRVNVIINEILARCPKTNYKFIINILSETIILGLDERYPQKEVVDKCLELLKPWLSNTEHKPGIDKKDDDLD
jgi:hypothetical protein